MKKQLNYILSLVVGAALTVFSSCTPDEYELPGQTIAPEDLVEGIAFTITHDKDNPNIIHLQSLMPSQYTVAWQHPQGNATSATCDLKMPFAGEYEVKFGVNTRAGIVWSEPAKFTVDDMCEEFINGDLWKIIVGGPGQSKTWVLDIDENGKTYSDVFKSPMWYFNTGYTWDMLHNAKGENYIDSNPWDPETAIDTNFPIEGWYWAADYAGNSWMCTAADYGTFTFDLVGGANITMDSPADGERKGLFMINEDNRTLKLTNICFPTIDSRVADCYDFSILYATENFLQLLCHTGDGATSICLNFTTKAYRDNWEEPVKIGLPAGWFEVFSYQNLFGTYQLSSDDTYDYFALDEAKTRLNLGGSLDETADYTLKFDCPTVSNFYNKGRYEASFPDGSVSGTFTADSTGTITLDNGLGIIEQFVGSGVAYNPSDMEVLDVTVEDGKIVDIWLGARLKDFAGNDYQYIGFHYIPVIGGQAPAETFKVQAHYFDIVAWSPDIYSDYVRVEDGKPASIVVETDMSASAEFGYYIEVEKILAKYPNCDVKINWVAVDGTRIDIGDETAYAYSAEVDINARRTLVNAWNLAACPVDAFSFRASSSIEINFTVTFDSGTPYADRIKD